MWWLLGTLYGLLFWTVYAYNFALIRQGLGFKALLVAGGAGSLLIAAGATAGQRLVDGWLYGGSAGGFLFTMSMNTSPALIAFLVSMLLAGGHLREEEQAENERLRAENEHMQSHTLEQQLAPHFLFNTLSTLEGLTASGDTRAPHYVRRLAVVYRYSLRHAGRSTLREEMDFVHAYVELMGVRYGKALRVVEELDEKLLGREVPAVSVQLLVENAIKHNVATLRNPLEVKVESVGGEGEGEAWVRVSNRLQPRADSGPGGGTGLENLMERYRLLAGKKIEIAREGGQFAVKIPLI